MTAPRFTVVTAVFNGMPYLAETIRSVRSQTLAEIEYIIVDGGSTDGSRELIRKEAQEDSRIRAIFEPDQGMYDAIFKGFRAGTAPLCAWINSDDKLMPWALEVAVEAMQNPGFSWVTGVPGIWDSRGRLVSVGNHSPFPRWVIRRGFCHERAYGFIQQESTFFARELLEAIPADAMQRILRQRLAGDFLLWTELVRRAPLRLLPTVLGGFRVHAGNRSGDTARYYQEIRDAGFWVPPAWMRPFFRALRMAAGVMARPARRREGRALEATLRAPAGEARSPPPAPRAR